MDLMNRASRPAQLANQTVAPSNTSAPVPQHHGGANRRRDGKDVPIHRISTVVLLFLATVLVVSVVAVLMLDKIDREGSYVDNKKMQAVFVNGGQVYFGRIGSLNGRFLSLHDIYYLRVNQQVQPEQQDKNPAAKQDISLVKLGCELHGPEDRMIINRDQVVFWENLKDDGQVAKAVAEYVKANPDGQKCETAQQNEPKTEENKTPTPTTNRTP